MRRAGGRALSQLKSRSSAEMPAPAKDAVAAAPHADTLSSVPRLTSVDSSTAPVTTFWYACAAIQEMKYYLPQRLAADPVTFGLKSLPVAAALSRLSEQRSKPPAVWLALRISWNPTSTATSAFQSWKFALLICRRCALHADEPSHARP